MGLETRTFGMEKRVIFLPAEGVVVVNHAGSGGILFANAFAWLPKEARVIDEGSKNDRARDGP